jgi:GntR family transcriptional regulator, galactonate operon transcriptional repressor
MRRTASRESSERRAVPHSPRAGLHRRIIVDIGRLIVTGAIGPGELVPAAARVGASRGVMREAINVLAAKGLVASRPRTGTRVRPRDEWNLLDPDVLAWRQEGLERQHVLGHLTEVRLIIEPAAAELAARRAGPEQVREIQAALLEMRDALDRTPPDHEAYNAADVRFHRSVVQASYNEILEQMGAVVTRALLVAFDTAVRVPGLARGSLERHQTILDAIRRGQVRRARVAMSGLVQNTGRAIAKLPRARAPKPPRKA